MDQQAHPPFSSLPFAARVYVSTVAVLALAFVVIVGATGAMSASDALLVGVLVVACAAGNLFEVFMPGNYSFQPNGAFIFMGCLILPPWAIGIVAVASFVPAVWLKRTAWYKGAFNIGNYAICGVATSLLIGERVTNGETTPQDLVTLLGAAMLFAVINHLLIVGVISAAGERHVLRAAREAFKGLRPDVALGFTGACFALLWAHQPLTLVLAAGPTWLVYQGLTVPLLAHKARTDAKTGLANFEHFTQTFDDMLTSARRHGSQVGVVMLDMDHLRDVNNTWGHLIGDRAIRAISHTLADVTAAYGLAARFGGEEFCLLLPNTSASAAAQVAEDVRRRVEAIRFREQDEAAGLRITVSAGVSAFPQHGGDRDSLIEAADIAVYEAKAAGRNQVRVAPVTAAAGAPAGYQPSARVATA